jgi:integrase
VRRIALGHSDRERAKAAAEQTAAALRSAAPAATAQATLATLFDIYLREVTPSKGAGKQRHDRVCAEMFRRAFGEAREARSLTRREWDRFIRERLSGALAPKGVTTRRPVGARVVGYDLSWLLAVLNWATLASNGRGGALLERNPLKGLPVPREESPARPIIDDDEYRELLRVADSVSDQFRLALVLAHETGHRISAVRQLRWSDIDEAKRVARWRASHDKIGFEHATPLTADALDALADARSRRPAIGDAWVFPAPGEPSLPCSRHLMRDWWTRACDLAKLEPVKRRGWHSLRRQFATELKATPLKDLCQLGGWKDPQTILRCYQQPDEETMRSALEQRRTLRAAAGKRRT